MGGGTTERDPLDAIVANYLPAFVQRLVHVRCGDGSLGKRLERERRIEVLGVAEDAATAELPTQEVDAVYVPAYKDVSDLTATLTSLLPRLSKHGMVLIATPNPGYWRRIAEPAPQRNSPLDIATALASLGLSLYFQWSIEDGSATSAGAGRGKIWIDGHTFDAPTEFARRDLITLSFLQCFTRADYDPVAHARALLQQGRPSAAYDLLLQVPEAYSDSPEVHAAVSAESQLCLLVMDRREGSAGRLVRFARAQRHFYHATSRVPGHPVAFECQIRFWRLIGDEAMAADLERIYRQLHPGEAGNAPPRAVRNEPAIELPSRDYGGIRRVLVLTRTLPDYGLDVLYDGLCRVLGDANVVEFPWKASLHGEAPEQLAHYPCVFDRPGASRTEEEIVAEAAAGKFDLILYGELDTWMNEAFLRRLAGASATPWMVVDQRDDPDDARAAFAARIPEIPIRGYFKREWLQCVDWDGPVAALPFAYPDGLVPEDVSYTRSRAVFYAGHAGAGLRRAFLDHVASTLGLVFPDRLPQEKYRAALMDSRMGLNFFGYGFDTVRYWELAAHGCMVVSNRLPIRVPHNFVDGESAVFFDDLHDLEEKLRHYLMNPEEAEAISRAGYAHFVKHHTGSVRATQLLEAAAAYLALE